MTQYNLCGYNYTILFTYDPYDRIVANDNSMIVIDKSILGNMEKHPFYLQDIEGNKQLKDLHFSIVDNNIDGAKEVLISN